MVQGSSIFFFFLEKNSRKCEEFSFAKCNIFTLYFFHHFINTSEIDRKFYISLSYYLEHRVCVASNVSQ